MMDRLILLKGDFYTILSHAQYFKVTQVRHWQLGNPSNTAKLQKDCREKIKVG